MSNPLGTLLVSFGPAVMFASGKGMTFPPDPVPPEMNAFLQGQTIGFDPALLTGSTAGPHILGAYVDTFTLTHWLLFYSVGWVWRLFGISLESLHLLAGVMGSLTALALYLLFRLGMKPLTSGVGALFTMLLPPFLLVAPSLRDYSKAPFILVFIALVCRLHAGRRTRGDFLRYSFFLTLPLGVGFGFRQDILICVPVAVVAVLTAPVGDAHHLRTRIVGIGITLALFALLSFPVFRGMRHESASVTSHTLFQGLSREAEQVMGFGDASYDLLLTPSDPEVHAVVNAHARARGVDAPMSLYLSPAYAQAGQALFRQWALTFPADLFARGLASADAVLRLSTLTLESPHYPEIRAATQHWRCLHLHTVWTHYIEPFGYLFLVAALYATRLRKAGHIFLSLMLLGYFMAYPSLLFQLRHTFHLSFIVPWAVFFLGERMAIFIPSLCRKNDLQYPGNSTVWKENTISSVRKTSGILLLLIISLVVSMTLLRYVQDHTVRNMLEAYKNATLQPIETETRTHEDICVVKPRHPLPGLEESWNLPVGDAATSYLVLSFAPTENPFPVYIRYSPGQGPYFTRHIVVTPADGETRYFVPVYALADFTPADFILTRLRFGNSPLVNLLTSQIGVNVFEGIGLRPDTLPLLKGIHYIEAHSRLPWLLYLRTTNNAREERVYKRQRLEIWAARTAIELRYLWHGTPERAIEELCALLARHPGQDRLKSRILDFIPRLREATSRAEIMFHLAGYDPNSQGQFAIMLANIARELEATERLTSAETVYRRALLLAPTDVWLRANLADLLRKQDNTEEAISLYEDILNRNPEMGYSAIQIDALLLQAPQEERLLSFWAVMNELHPDAIIPAIHLAQAYERLKRTEDAARLYRQVLAAHDNHSESRLRLGALLARKNENDQGLEMMQQAVEADPQLRFLYVELLSDAARQSMVMGNHAAARERYENALVQAPDNLALLAEFAAALTAMGNPEDAIQQYAALLLQAPESPHSAIQFDTLCVQSGLEHNILPFWRRLHDQYPDAIMPVLHLAREYERLGNTEEAARLYDRASVLCRDAIALHPDDLSLRMRLADLYSALGREEQALEVLQHVVWTQPETPAAPQRIDDIYQRRGDETGRLAFWRSVVQEHPEAKLPRAHLDKTLESLPPTQDTYPFK